MSTRRSFPSRLHSKDIFSSRRSVFISIRNRNSVSTITRSKLNTVSSTVKSKNHKMTGASKNKKAGTAPVDVLTTPVIAPAFKDVVVGKAGASGAGASTKKNVNENGAGGGGSTSAKQSGTAKSTV